MIPVEDATFRSNIPVHLNSIAIGYEQIYDANIVASMQPHGLRRPMTHNTAGFARLGAFLSIEPLVSTP